MADLKQRLESGQNLLWLDHFEYAARLLARDDAPWLDSTACIAWLRNAQGLLGSDVLGLPLATISARWLGAHRELRDAMAARTRLSFALKALLADASLRAHLVELVRGVRASFADTPLALVCPSPRAWLVAAFQAAHGSAPATMPDDDATDGASVYLADFLRIFADSGVDVLLLQDRDGQAPGPLQDLVLCQPIFNVAAYYRWAVGIETGQRPDPETCAALDFILAPEPCPELATGVLVPEAFWSGSLTAGQLAPHPFRHARIPPGAEPETVLSRLAQLRA